MFDKKRFAQIIKNISYTYDNQRIFAEMSEINRTYLSQYMNMKLSEPPKPAILQKLASASNEITNYEELMIVCGYLDKNMEFTEIFKNIFYKYRPVLEELKLDEKIIDAMYNMTLNHDKNKNTKQFKILADKLPQKTQDKVYEISSKILSEIEEIMSNSLRSISLRTKYKIEDNIIKDIHMCPVYGRISAGQPNWAEECIEGRIPIDPNMMNIVNPEECYFLRVSGESMNKKVKNGAFALIQKTDYVENGEIAVVLVNGYDATLKKFSKQGDLIILEPMSTDPSFTAQVYDKNTEVKVIGKYLGKMEME